MRVTSPGMRWVAVLQIHKTNIYLEYHSVCPLVGIGNPLPPLPQASVYPPPPPPPPPSLRRGERVSGWGSPSSDNWRKSLALCLLCMQIHTLTCYSNRLVSVPVTIRVLKCLIQSRKFLEVQIPDRLEYRVGSEEKIGSKMLGTGTIPMFRPFLRTE